MVHTETGYFKSENGWYARTVRGDLRLLGIRERTFNLFYQSIKSPGRSPNFEDAPAIVKYLQYHKVLDTTGRLDIQQMKAFDRRRTMLSYLCEEDFTRLRLASIDDFPTISSELYGWEHDGGSLDVIATTER